MKKESTISTWIERRLPIKAALSKLASYQTPKNLNYLYNFGVLLGISMIIQIVTGICLAMQYTPHTSMAFHSVQRIMRDVHFGWLIRYMHSVGSSMLFLCTYFHVARGLFYRSYKEPRELVWIFGVMIFICLIITAFMGYVLPWSQMGFWGAKVITSLFSVIPVIGEDIVHWILGSFDVGNPTLNRFFALHYLFPFLIIVISVIHLVALRVHGSTNPTGKETKKKVPFHPYYTFKDMFVLCIFLLIFSYFVFFEPEAFTHPDSYTEANPLVTPKHIVPEWYFLPFYGILRSIPNKLAGVIFMFLSIFVLFLLPWLDRNRDIEMPFKPKFKFFTMVFFVNFIFLGYIGSQSLEEPFLTIGRFCTTWYFLHFFFILPIVSRRKV